MKKVSISVFVLSLIFGAIAHAQIASGKRMYDPKKIEDPINSKNSRILKQGNGPNLAPTASAEKKVPEKNQLSEDLAARSKNRRVEFKIMKH